MRIVRDTINYSARHLPRYNPVNVSGYHIREAGSTAAQELAFTLADGMEYVRWGIARGMDVDEFAPRLSFFFNAHNDFFEEIAKYRAARKLWAEAMKTIAQEFNPLSDLRASADYRRRVLSQLLERAWVERRGHHLVRLEDVQ